MAESKKVKPWHKYLHELKDAIHGNDKVAFGRSVDEALGADHIVRTQKMLIDGNEFGRSYNCMGQSTMGLNLLRAAQKWQNEEWMDDGIAAMNVMLKKYENGGLRLRDTDSDTSWYCGVTSRDKDTKGATLNKHLYATRTFFEAAEVMRDLGNTKLAARYEEAGEEGFLKLVKGSEGPKLKDYFVRNDDGDFVLNSWTYYSLGNADKDKPYFLAVPEKNANYHIYEMKLIFRIANIVENGGDTDGDFDFSPFLKEHVSYYSSFGAYLRVYENKLKSGGLESNTFTLHGQFASTLNGNGDRLGEEKIDFFKKFLYPEVILGTSDDDFLEGTGLGELVKGQKGDDKLVGKGGPDTLRGGRGNDALKGSHGEDTLVGGFGKDVLIGGEGEDVFRFRNVGESQSGGIRDQIADFERGSDIIHLSRIDARTDKSGNQSLQYIGDAKFSEKPGELRFADEILAADTDGDGRADFSVAVRGIVSMSESDFIL